MVTTWRALCALYSHGGSQRDPADPSRYVRRVMLRSNPDLLLPQVTVGVAKSTKTEVSGMLL